MADNLNGALFCFTGALRTMKRSTAEEIVHAKGGFVASSLTGNVDTLVVGDKPGTKLEKAKKMGCTVLTEDEFLELVGEEVLQ